MNTPTFKDLAKLAWPVIVSRSTQVIVGLSDALMIAHLGEAALAAVTTGGMNSYAAFIFPMGIASIIASFSSQLLGRGEPASARRFAWYGLILAVLTHMLMLAALPFLPLAMAWFDYTPEVEAAMTAYLSIRMLSTGPAVAMEAMTNYYGGLGNTVLPMKANIVAMVCNVVLNWLLINGHWGFPQLGLEGAAWASVISTSFAFSGLVADFLWQGQGLPWQKLQWHEFGRMLRFGVPAGLNWSFEFFAFIAFVNIVVAGLGTSSLAAMMSVIQLNSLAFMPAFGLASAGAILAGQSIGANLKDQVPSIVRMTFLANAAWMGVVGFVYLLFPAVVLAPFTPPSSDGSFLKVGMMMLAMSAAWQVFDAAALTLSEALRAAGDTAYSMWSRAILAWVFFLPGAMLTVRYWGGGELAAMLWLLAYLVLLAAILYWRFQSGAWRQMQLIEENLLA